MHFLKMWYYYYVNNTIELFMIIQNQPIEMCG